MFKLQTSVYPLSVDKSSATEDYDCDVMKLLQGMLADVATYQGCEVRVFRTSCPTPMHSKFVFTVLNCLKAMLEYFKTNIFETT